jgi:hypothetical protein
VVLVLLIAGDQVPVRLFIEVVAKVNEPPEQIGDTWVKAGIVGALTVTVMVVFVAHWPIDGVNV